MRAATARQESSCCGYPAGFALSASGRIPPVTLPRSAFRTPRREAPLVAMILAKQRRTDGCPSPHLPRHKHGMSRLRHVGGTGIAIGLPTTQRNGQHPTVALLVSQVNHYTAIYASVNDWVYESRAIASMRFAVGDDNQSLENRMGSQLPRGNRCSGGAKFRVAVAHSPYLAVPEWCQVGPGRAGRIWIQQLLKMRTQRTYSDFSDSIGLVGWDLPG